MGSHRRTVIPLYLLCLMWSTFIRIVCKYSVRTLATTGESFGFAEEAPPFMDVVLFRTYIIRLNHTRLYGILLFRYPYHVAASEPCGCRIHMQNGVRVRFWSCSSMLQFTCCIYFLLSPANFRLPVSNIVLLLCTTDIYCTSQISQIFHWLL